MRILAAALPMLALTACGGEVRIECGLVPAIDDQRIAATYPVVGQPARQEAEAIASAYLTNAFCTGALPPGSRFAAHGFTAADLGPRYRVAGFAPGFGKQPAGLRVRFRNGTDLLFCFHRAVLACDPDGPCRCPYDDQPLPGQT